MQDIKNSEAVKCIVRDNLSATDTYNIITAEPDHLRESAEAVDIVESNVSVVDFLSFPLVLPMLFV